MAKGVIVFLGLIWAAFLLNLVLPVDLDAYGLAPRTLSGLIGVATMTTSAIWASAGEKSAFPTKLRCHSGYGNSPEQG